MANIFIILLILGTAECIDVVPHLHLLEGGSATLHCRPDDYLRGQENLMQNRKWFKDAQPIMQSSGKKYEGLDELKLTINNLTLKDSGEYKCECTVGLRKEISTPYNLVVNYGYSTRVIDLQVGTDPLIGQDRRFECQVTRDGLPVLVTHKTWYHNGVLIQRSTKPFTSEKYKLVDIRGLVLLVNNLTSEDSGGYNCVIHNTADTGRSELLHFRVHYPPAKPNILPDVGRVEAFSILNLTCQSVDPGYPYAFLFTWVVHHSERHQDVTNSSPDSSVLHLGESLLSHVGVLSFKCQAQNEFLSEWSDEIRINVEAPPTIIDVSVIKAEENNLLQCTVLRSPSTVTNWLHNGLPLPSNPAYDISYVEVPGSYKYGVDIAVINVLLMNIQDNYCNHIDHFSGNFTCVVYNAFDKSTAAYSDIINIQPQDHRCFVTIEMKTALTTALSIVLAIIFVFILFPGALWFFHKKSGRPGPWYTTHRYADPEQQVLLGATRPTITHPGMYSDICHSNICGPVEKYVEIPSVQDPILNWLHSHNSQTCMVVSGPGCSGKMQTVRRAVQIYSESLAARYREINRAAVPGVRVEIRCQSVWHLSRDLNVLAKILNIRNIRTLGRRGSFADLDLTQIYACPIRSDIDQVVGLLSSVLSELQKMADAGCHNIIVFKNVSRDTDFILIPENYRGFTFKTIMTSNMNREIPDCFAHQKIDVSAQQLVKRYKDISFLTSSEFEEIDKLLEHSEIGRAIVVDTIHERKCTPSEYLTSLKKQEDENPIQNAKFEGYPPGLIGAIQLSLSDSRERLEPDQLEIYELSAFLSDTSLSLHELYSAMHCKSPEDDQVQLWPTMFRGPLFTLENNILHGHPLVADIQKAAWGRHNTIQRLQLTLYTMYRMCTEYDSLGIVPHVETVLHFCENNEPPKKSLAYAVGEILLHLCLANIYESNKMLDPYKVIVNAAQKLVTKICCRETDETNTDHLYEMNDEQVMHKAKVMHTAISGIALEKDDDDFKDIMCQFMFARDHDDSSLLPTDNEKTLVRRGIYSLLVDDKNILPISKIKRIFLSELYASVQYSFSKVLVLEREAGMRVDPDAETQYSTSRMLSAGMSRYIETTECVDLLLRVQLCVQTDIDGKHAKKIVDQLQEIRSRYKNNNTLYELGVKIPKIREKYYEVKCLEQMFSLAKSLSKKVESPVKNPYRDEILKEAKALDIDKYLQDYGDLDVINDMFVACAGFLMKEVHHGNDNQELILKAKELLVAVCTGITEAKSKELVECWYRALEKMLMLVIGGHAEIYELKERLNTYIGILQRNPRIHEVQISKAQKLIDILRQFSFKQSLS